MKGQQGGLEVVPACRVILGDERLEDEGDEDEEEEEEEEEEGEDVN